MDNTQGSANECEEFISNILNEVQENELNNLTNSKFTELLDEIKNEVENADMNPLPFMDFKTASLFCSDFNQETIEIFRISINTYLNALRNGKILKIYSLDTIIALLIYEFDIKIELEQDKQCFNVYMR